MLFRAFQDRPLHVLFYVYIFIVGDLVEAGPSDFLAGIHQGMPDTRDMLPVTDVEVPYTMCKIPRGVALQGNDLERELYPSESDLNRFFFSI